MAAIELQATDRRTIRSRKHYELSHKRSLRCLWPESQSPSFTALLPSRIAPRRHLSPRLSSGGKARPPASLGAGWKKAT